MAAPRAIVSLLGVCGLLCFIGTAECLLLTTGGLECFQCHNVNSADECHSTDACPSHQICYANSSRAHGGNTTFNFGCKPQGECPSSHQPIASIIGRAVVSPTSAVQPPPTGCSQCCLTDYCNKRLCNVGAAATTTSGGCNDHPDYNCPLINASFNICADVQHAKSVCKRFCGLCNIVDGGWGAWSPWSTCDVTCNSGTASRSRDCTNPAPSHGGRDCVGNKVDTKACYAMLCPVHGGWSDWVAWSTCSVTCGIGMERRERSCTNPRPGPLGSHCFGTNLDVRNCFPGACHDGGWSRWSDWTNCGTTCGGGLSTRARTCSNPPPSPLGRMCTGSTDQTVMCNTFNCPTDGGWSRWSDWTNCSTTCGGGLSSRARTCSNPPPSPLGRMCTGSTNQTVMCNTFNCTTVASLFSVVYPPSKDKMLYVLYKVGNDYNKTADKFTCAHSGLYLFTLSTLFPQNSPPVLNCFLKKNNVRITQTNMYTDSGPFFNSMWQSMSTTKTIHLINGDTITIGDCNEDTIYSFSGFLITGMTGGH